MPPSTAAGGSSKPTVARPVVQRTAADLAQDRTAPQSAEVAGLAPASTEPPILRTEDLTVSYGGQPAVRGVTMDIPRCQVTAIIGPSGCGKSTLLRAFNRMNDFIEGVTVDGRILFDGADVHDPDVDPVEVRRRIGMVFQRPNPFPKSIFENVAWGPRVSGFTGDLHELVVRSLQQAALWDEVKDKLRANGHSLSGGQQQRLCIARALAMEPEVLLMDEPCSALDPIATDRIEDLIDELKSVYTVVIVTHNMQQAARISDLTAFMLQGELIETGPTERIFTRPAHEKTEDYVTGRFG